MKQTGKSIVLFLIITLLLSALNDYFIIALGFPVTWFLMWSPGVAAIIVAKIYRSESIVLGVRKFKKKETLQGILFPVVYLGLSYGVYWLTTGSFDPSVNELFAYPLLILVSIPINILAALGEEIGWRGFLTPKLTEVMGFWKAAVMSGLIWSVWHFPLIISGDYLGGVSLWLSLLIFTIQLVSIGTIMMFLRLSGSVWPAVLFHASHNLIDQVFLNPSTSGASSYFVGETGVLTTVAAFVCMILVWMKHRQDKTISSKN